jgi:hypothetical protein
MHRGGDHDLGAAFAEQMYAVCDWLLVQAAHANLDNL